jgi:ABC-type transporter Mla subunit MlaD
MANQIKRSEIAEEDLYKEIRESADKTIKIVETLNNNLEKTAKVLQTELKKPLDNTIESIEKLQTSSNLMSEAMEHSLKLDKAKADAVKSQIKADENLRKIEQERLKLKKQLTDATDEEVKAKIKYQKASAEQKKILADEIILNDENAGTLEKVAAQSRILRREREKLNLETVEGKKRLKEINDQLDENNEIIRENSDALKQQKLNVGNYTDSIKEATGELGGLIGGIKDSIDALKGQVQQFVVLGKSADTAGKKVRLFGKALKAIGIGAIIALLGSMVSAMADTNQGVRTMQGLMQKAMASVTMFGNIASDKFDILKLKLEAMQLKFEEIFNGFGTTPQIQERLTAIGLEIEAINKKEYKPKDMIQSINDVIIKQQEYEWQLAKTSEEIESLMGREELLSESAGDMTISFDKQRKAQELYNQTVVKRIALEKELLSANVDNEAYKVRARLISAGFDYSLQQIKNLEFMNNEKALLSANNEEILALSEAKTQLIAKDNELASALAKNAMEGRNTAKDDFEKQLDYAIDLFDVEKTIHERRINMERTTLAERKRLTEEVQKLADSSFANQVELVQKYTKQMINFTEIMKSNDEAEIRSMLNKYDLNETTLTRIMEMIKERKLVEQDLADLQLENALKQVELNKAVATSIQAIDEDNLSLRIEKAEREFDIEKQLEDRKLILQDKTYENLKLRLDEIKKLKIQQLMDIAYFERETAQQEIIEQEEKTKKLEEINSKLANDIIRLENETADKKREIGFEELDNERELLEVRREMVLNGIQSLTDITNELADKRIAKIDEEIEASQRRFDSLQSLAESGNILARESMAEEAKLMAEQNRKREQEEKRKQRIQLASSVLQAYVTNSNNPQVKNPLQKTITDTVLLTEFIKSLPAFFDGTEDTGKNGNGIDNKGGFLSVLHPNERVVTARQNELIGGMSNEELSKLAYNYQNGMIRPITDTALSNGFAGVEILAKKLDSLERTIANKPEHTIQVEQIIGGAMAITRNTKKGNTNIYNRYRVS